MTYYNNAVAAMESIFNNTKAPVAFAPINDVSKLDSGFMDDTESFFFAEVMKYLYAPFAGYILCRLDTHRSSQVLDL